MKHTIKTIALCASILTLTSASLPAMAAPIDRQCYEREHTICKLRAQKATIDFLNKHRTMKSPMREQTAAKQGAEVFRSCIQLVPVQCRPTLPAYPTLPTRPGIP